MFSRCTLGHYFPTATRSLESSIVRISSARPFHSSRSYLSVPTNAQQTLSSWDKSFQETNSVSDDVSQYRPRRPRQAMTTHESNAFNEMFAMIFEAATAQEKSSISSDSVIGVGMDGIDDLIGKLRKYPKRLKWSTELDDMLDRQKEVINLFTNAQDLLEWTTDAVFGESERYEAAARKAISEVASSGVKGDVPMLQPPTYPYLVALIMQKFREKFNNPHLALSIFEHARSLSTASYVFGCSSQAYHQLIETRWKCFRDLTGVLEALQEMQLNCVKVSGQTRRLVEQLRREIGEKHLWTDEFEVGSNDVLNVLAQIERLALSNRGATPHADAKATALLQERKWDEWKSLDLQDEGDDEWAFDQWSSRPRKSAWERTSDEIKRPIGSTWSKRSKFEENTGKPFADASGSQSIDSFWRDGCDINEDKPINNVNMGATNSNSMDDWSLDSEEDFSGLSNSKAGTYGNKDEWGFSRGESQKRGVEERREGMGERPIKRVRSKRFGLKDDCGSEGESQKRDVEEQGWEDTGERPIKTVPKRFGIKADWDSEDGDPFVGLPDLNVQGSHDGDAAELDQEPSSEPKRGRILNRRRFGLRDAPQQPQE